MIKLEGLSNRRTPGDQQSEGRSDEFNKKIKCPKWPVTDSFKSFKSNLLIWDKCHQSKGKYLELIDSLEESKRTMEKQKIELEVQNEHIYHVMKMLFLKLFKRCKSGLERHSLISYGTLGIHF